MRVWGRTRRNSPIVPFPLMGSSNVKLLAYFGHAGASGQVRFCQGYHILGLADQLVALSVNSDWVIGVILLHWWIQQLSGNNVLLRNSSNLSIAALRPASSYSNPCRSVDPMLLLVRFLPGTGAGYDSSWFIGFQGMDASLQMHLTVGPVGRRMKRL
jgi:hypothetical protein